MTGIKDWRIWLLLLAVLPITMGILWLLNDLTEGWR
jgi:hypothetical protein